MRIISGRLGGRRFQPPARMPHTRPTTDVAKEGLFNILEHQFSLEGATTLDLFGGTGSISYELASRGADALTVVEKDPTMAAFIRKNTEVFGLTNFRVIQKDVFRFLEQCTDTFDLIFAGPPYALSQIDRLPELIFERKLLKPGGWFILEHTPRNNYSNSPFLLQARNYGTTVFSIFQQPSAVVPSPDPKPT